MSDTEESNFDGGPPTPPASEAGSVGPNPQGVPMELSRIIISDLQDQQVIVLHEVDGDRQFPIVIGNPEAMAINRRLKHEPAARPLTHDLLATVVEAMGGTVDRIEIHSLFDHTFFARIVIKRPSGKKGKVGSTNPFDWIEVDSRPSDAIAVGVATNVPIYVSRQVLDEVGG
jgi:bifunctional DNase/RNase